MTDAPRHLSAETLESLLADTDPYLFGTDCEGILTRLSAEALLNVTAGTGTVTASMLVEPKG